MGRLQELVRWEQTEHEYLGGGGQGWGGCLWREGEGERMGIRDWRKGASLVGHWVW